MFGSRSTACFSTGELLKGFQVFDQVELLLIGQSEAESGIIALNHVEQSFETAIMIKTAFVLGLHEQSSLAHKKTGQVHRLIITVRRAIRLEAVDAHLSRSMIVPAWFSPEGFAMATVAIGLAAEQFVASRSRSNVEVHAGCWFGRRNGKLKAMQGWQLGSYQIIVGIGNGRVTKPHRGGDGKLVGVVQSFVEERPNAMEFQDRYQSVPVSY